MAATFNVFFKITGVLNSLRESAGDLHNPTTLVTSADIISDRTVAVTSATTSTIMSIGSGGNLASAVAIVIIPSVAGALCFGSTDANNSAVMCAANVPFILTTGNTLPYQNTIDNRIDETAAAIATIKYRPTSSSGKVRIFGIG